MNRKEICNFKDYTENEIEDLITSNFQTGKTVREPQMRALKFLIKSYLEGKKHCILQLPTGVGKSLIAETFSKIYKQLTVTKPHLNGTSVITKTKALQEQYVDEFFIPTLKGQNNYPCYLPRSKFSYGDDDCFKKRKECSASLCPYLKAMDVWRRDVNLKVTNFALALSCPPKVCDVTQEGDFRSQNLIIDECHEFNESIISQATLEFSPSKFNINKFKYPEVDWTEFDSQLQEFFGFFIEQGQERFTMIMPYAKKFLLFIKRNMEYLTPSVTKGSATTAQIVYFKTLQDIGRKVLGLVNKDIVFYMNEIESNDLRENEQILILKPLFESELVINFFNKFDFIIHMSATIGNLDLYAKNLGIVDYNTYEESSPFKLENRKIVFANIINFNYNNREEALKLMLEVMEELLDFHFSKDENGIIHVSSYYQAEYLRKNSKYKDELRVPRNAQDVEVYKNKYTLLSPSMHEGYDFKDDLARFQIMIKLPYPSLGDTYIRLKTDIVDGWYEKQTLNKFIQAYGRGVRHYDDWCIFYILDGNFGRHINSKVIPNYVKEAIELK
jgi:Rad3-related DNA helicase